MVHKIIMMMAAAALALPLSAAQPAKKTAKVKKEYKKTIERTWTYLTETAVQEDGKVGYVQPIGERAIPGQTVDANSQANFGVGAMLLVACEYDKYLATK